MDKGDDPPPPPDPMKTAAAQTDQSVATAIANTIMGQVNRHGPDGNLSYDQTGSYTFTGPGGTYTIPRFTATTELTPDGQAISDANMGARLNLANLGREQSGRLGNLLNRPVDTEGVTPAADRTVSRVPTYGAGPGAPDYATIDQGEGYERLGAGPSYRRGPAEANYASVGAGPSYGRLNDDANLNDSYQTDFTADRQRVEDALFARLNPQLDLQRENIKRELSGRGVMPGTPGYDRAMEEYGRTANDARISSILAAGQEHQRLSEEARAAGAFTNQARQQSYANRTGEAAYNNQLTGLEREDEFNRAGFNNDTASRAFAEGLAVRGFDNDATAAERADEVQRTGYNNSLVAQALADRMNVAGFNNQAAGQGFADRMALTARGDANANNAFSMRMSELDAQDRSRASQLNERFAIRNQPLQELLSIMNGTALQNPNFALATPDRIANTDIAGLTQQGYQNQFANWQQQQQMRQAMMGGLFDLGAAFLGRPPTG